MQSDFHIQYKLYKVNNFRNAIWHIIKSYKLGYHRFRMQGDANSFYSIKSKHAGRVLDVCQDADTKGMLIIYDNYSGPNQLFNLKQSGV